MFLCEIITNALVSFAIFELIISPFLTNKSLSRTILLGSSSIILMLCPYLFFLKSSENSLIFHVIQAAGVSIYPAGIITGIYFFFIAEEKIKNKKLPLYVFLLCSPVFILSLFFKDQFSMFFSIQLIIFNIFLFFYITKDLITVGRVYIYIKSAQSIFIITTIISLITNNPAYMLIFAGAFHCMISCIYLILIFNRTQIVLNNIQKLKYSYKRLVQHISRQTEKMEQLKRIIRDKDTELLQISRHASLAEITAGIAHEITQPLTGIKGIAQNMIDDINYNEFENLAAVSELLKICSLVDKSSSIIDHIRNFSKKSCFSMLFVDMNKVILDALDLINIQFKKNNIEISLDLENNADKLYGDKIALEQLIINLLLNARDAIIKKRKIEDSDFLGQIKISSRTIEETINLTIEDNGSGIPQDIIKNIWIPFFTTKRNENSTGLGLSISIKIIKEHNGDVAIESQPGSGTKFIIKFPIKKRNQLTSIT